MSYDFVLTTDRTLMTNHHGKEFIGFMTTSPAVGMPEFLWMWLSAPKPKLFPDGRPIEAPYGMRKVEAALLNAGFKAAIVDPDALGRHLPTAKALMIGHHDYFAFSAPSNTWWAVTKREPVNRKYFRKLMESRPVREFKSSGGLIIIGGPAAWQWLHVPHLVEKWGVDSIVDGEAEKMIVELAQRILDGEPIPRYVFMAPGEAPSLEEIPVIKGASVNGLVEIMRGCPRGCKFCSVTLRPLRFIPIEKIIQEIRVNKSFGVEHVLLHSEDNLLYGADGVKPREGPLLRLHRSVLSEKPESLGWAHLSLAAAVYAEKNGKILSKLTEEIFSKTGQSYLGVQTGLETGSRRLAKIIMPAKAAPYEADKWPEVAEEAFAILADANIVPAATIILNLPEERPEDLQETIELMDRLRDYPSLIVPMYFVPMGVLKSEEELLKFRIKVEHVEVMWKTLEHSLYWSKKLVDMYLSDRPVMRRLVGLFIKFIEAKKKSLEKKVREIIEQAAQGKYVHTPSEGGRMVGCRPVE